MRIGILADIHEDVEQLTLALTRLRAENVDRIVVLGDVFDMGRRVAETVRLLTDAEVIGVWGNHDLGLCHDPSEWARTKYAGPVLDFMQTLQPRLVLEDCLFSHGLPCWDPTDPTIYYLGDRPETVRGLADTFAAAPHRVTFVGHFHRWLLATPEGRSDWDGGSPVQLDPGRRYLGVIGAVCDGWCATFDTAGGWLTPCPLDCPRDRSGVLG